MFGELKEFTKRVAPSSLWLFLNRLVSQALAVVFTILVARSLGETGLGQYAFVAAVLFIGNIITTFGMDTLVIREIAGRREAAASLLGAALWIQIGLAVLFIAIIHLAAGLLPQKTPETLLSLRLYSLALVPMAFFTLFSAILHGSERMGSFLLANLVVVVQTAGGWLVLQNGGRLLELTWVLLAAQILGAAAAGIFCALRQPGGTGPLGFALPLRSSWAVFLAVLKRGMPLASLSGLAVIYQRLIILLLSLLASDSVTGWFAAAARTGEAFRIVHYAFFGALFPVLSQTAFKDPALPGTREEKPAFPRRIYRLSNLALAGFGLGLALALTFLAGPLVELLYGPGYGSSATPLKILSWSLIPYAYTSKISLELVTSGQEWTVVRATAVATGLTGLLSLIFIPGYELAGASVAALSGECILALNLRILKVPRRDLERKGLLETRSR